MLISSRKLHDIFQISDQYWLPDELWSFGSKTQLASFVEAPWIDVAVYRDGQSMWIPTTYFFDELILEHRDNSRVQNLLGHRLLCQMSKWILPQLSLSIWSPWIYNSMDVTLVDASILCVDDRWVGSQMLSLRTLLPVALPSLADHAALDAQTQAIFTFILLEALWAAPGWDHLCCLEEDSLLDLVVGPLLTWLVHNHVVFNQPRIKNFLVDGCMKNIFIHLAQELVQLLLVFGKLVPLLKQEILDTLPIDGPMDEGYFWDAQAVSWKILVNILGNGAQEITRFSMAIIIDILVALLIVKLQINFAYVCLQKRV